MFIPLVIAVDNLTTLLPFRHTRIVDIMFTSFVKTNYPFPHSCVILCAQGKTAEELRSAE